VTTVSQALERARLGLDAATIPRWTTAALLGLLCVVSLWLRTRVLGAGFWIDEGISVGIAHHPFDSIPHLLRGDGSPPLYYLLLHVWIGWFGDGERATHTLSLVFALACIPAAYWVGRSLFGRTAAWICALLATIDPYLTYYAQETRMYSLAALLSIVATGAYVHGVIEGRRRWLPALVVSLDLLLYTHNWGLFFCVGLAAATVVFARNRWREAVVAAAATAIVYAPWLPTLLDQARHTGAPWASRPGVYALVLAPGSVFAVDVAFGALALAAGAGLWRRRHETAAMSVLVVAGATILVAWLESQVSSSWTSRYFAVLLGPLLLAAGAGLARAGRLAIAAIALAVVLWAGYSLRDEKSNAREIAHAVAPSLRAGDLVLTTHPEQVPVLRYYLGRHVRYATQLGPVADPRVMDWRDALDRIERVSVRRDLEPVLATVKPGAHLVVVSPVFRDYRAWQAPWTRRVYLTSQAWTSAIARDPRFRRLEVVMPDEILRHRNYWKPLQAVVYVRRR
jgi:hypothetical protein